MPLKKCSQNKSTIYFTSMRRLIFIGPFEGWQPPTNGESAKNQILLKRLQQLYDKVVTIDTQNWRKNPLCMIKMGLSLLLLRNSKVIISACDEAAYKLITILKNIRIQKDICYVVIGGGLFDCIQEKGLNTRNYDYLRKIIVEGYAMKRNLETLGLKNVKVVPNHKPNYNLTPRSEAAKAPVKFVFLSRIEPLKGCTLITNCTKRLNDKGRSKDFEVTFYDRVAPEYEVEFNEINNGVENVHYAGLLNLRTIEGYKELQKYDVFLFPTYYFNEGFPGALVDAFIAGLPIVATDWHLNTEIVHDGETGFIIHPKDEDALFEVMENIIDNPSQLAKLAINSRKEAEKYDINKVWNKELLNEIGI